MSNQNLKSARARAMMTQEAVARAANIPVRLYQKYEYGDIVPLVTRAIRIAKVLGCKVEDLFRDQEKEAAAHG
jgi:DNA-binding XRE family transcriptional regulator